MTAVTVGDIFVPNKIIAGGHSSVGTGVNTPTFDSTTDRMAWVGPMPDADTIASVAFRTGTVTTGCVIKIEVQSVTNGRPSGTILAAGANGTVTVADSDDSVWKTVTIGTPPSVAKGDEVAIVLTYDSGTTPNMQLMAWQSAMAATCTMANAAFFIDTGAGTWASAVGVNSSIGYGPIEWVVTFGTAGPRFLPCLIPMNGAATQNAITSSSAPDEYALRGLFPFSCRIKGIGWCAANMAAGSNYTASLWPASSTTDGDALAQKAMDGDAATSTTADGNVECIFATPYSVSKNTTYYAGIRSDNANAVTVTSLSAAGTGAVTDAIQAFDSWTKSGEFYLSTRTWVAGSVSVNWAGTTTSLPLIYFIIDQIDDGDGAGGGGMRLAGHGGLAA